MSRADAVTSDPRGAYLPPAGRVTASAGVRSLPMLALALVLVAPACATKRDVRVLTDRIITMQQRQDSLLVAIQEQNRALIEAIRQNSDQLVRVQGTLGTQLVELQQQVVQVQELAGQSHVEIARLQDRIEQNRLAVQGPLDPSQPAQADAAEIYEAGMEMLNRGATGTARRAFEQFLTDYPAHPLAADALYQLAETYLQENPPDRDRALQELERVVQQYPDSPRAPAALYRAGVISEERGDRNRAMQYFNRVIGAYPGSAEERLARARLER
ncbi:MAG TPA: tetratricopeptide repeat protein [Longimicrobiales bacterium]|nr:tetratricopeptide repeat protein [Longimicrobiales bacterium]